MLGQQGGAAGRHHGLAHQKGQLGARPVRQAEMDGGVHGFELEVELGQPRRQVDGDARVGAEELRQARRQPARAEGGEDGQVQAAAARVGPKAQRGRGDAHQRAPDFLRIGLAGRAQAHGLALAHKELRLQPLLQRADLAADGALRQVQLGRSCREALVPGRRLEGAQQGHGGQETAGQQHGRGRWGNRGRGILFGNDLWA